MLGEAGGAPRVAAAVREGAFALSLRSVHAPCSAAGIRANTGFDYDALEHLPATPQPDAATLAQLRGRNVEELAETYPAFAKLMMEPI